MINARFVKPLDTELLRLEVERMGEGARVATVEEHVIAGGFGSALMEALAGWISPVQGDT
ncbi:MAG: transketolase C-terminal domain-containing protein [Thermoanaerobaculia bacterium]